MQGYIFASTTRQSPLLCVTEGLGPPVRNLCPPSCKRNSYHDFSVGTRAQSPNNRVQSKMRAIPNNHHNLGPETTALKIGDSKHKLIF